ncbi:MAG: hypothetical protein R2744_04775 [Bacteroidales bacterium]
MITSFCFTHATRFNLLTTLREYNINIPEKVKPVVEVIEPEKIIALNEQTQQQVMNEATRQIRQ